MPRSGSSDAWRRNQFAITTVAFVGFTGFTIVMPFLALYVRALGARDDGEVAMWTGLALGATPAVSALCAPLWGRVADRFGNKILVQRSLLSFVLVMIAMAFVTRPWHLFAMRTVQGVVAGYGSLTLSMVALSAPRDRLADALGTVQTAQRMGPAVGPIIGGVLARFVGLRQSFFWAAGFYAAAFLILTFFYREPPRSATPAVDPGRDRRVTFGNILAFENFVLLIGVIFVLSLVDRIFGPILPLYLGQVGYAEDALAFYSGVLFSTLAVAGAVGHVVAARVLRRFSARVVIAVSALGGGGALILFALGTSMWMLTPAMAAAGVAIGAATTAAFAAAGAVIPRHVHGTSFGFLTGSALTGSAISPVLSGLIGGQSIRVVFVASGVALALLAFLVRGLMVERNPHIEPTPVEEP